MSKVQCLACLHQTNFIRDRQAFGVRRPDAALLVFHLIAAGSPNRASWALKKRRRAAALQRLETQSSGSSDGKVNSAKL